MITVRINEAGRQVIARKLQGISALPKDMTGIFKRAHGHIRTGWQRHFAKEGSGWAALRPYTVAQREKEGYNGEGPIGIRSGSMLDSLLSDTANTIKRIGKQSAEFGARSRAIASFHFGAPANNQVARPITAFDAETKSAVIYEIRKEVKNILGWRGFNKPVLG